MSDHPTTQEAWEALETALRQLLTEMFAPFLRFAIRHPRAAWGIVGAYLVLVVVVCAASVCQS